MNKKELVKNLIKDIQDIYTIANRFENPEQIHPLDIDLALSKVRNLYELLLSLNPQELYSSEYQKEELLTSTQQAEKKIVEAPDQKVQAIKELEPEPEKPKETIPEAIHETKLIIETPKKDEVINKEEPVQKNKEKDVIEAKQSNGSHEIIADRFQSKKFVHDDIAKKNTKKDVSAKMQSKPINDINSAIGLNDKFIFIRELFSGDKDNYMETIQVLNNFDTYQNALEFLNENFDWNSEDPNFERLKELVRRKYS
ncbi:MAG: hypothetical protein PF485_07585 [Bacteroidales bacterium]|jgi:hypothetical protein|nr:hypothetical protein [Bacteroidales bacterium]